jgi:hypothetical protein
MACAKIWNENDRHNRNETSETNGTAETKQALQQAQPPELDVSCKNDKSITFYIRVYFKLKQRKNIY